MSRYVSFLLEDIPAEYLDAMVATQLWGEDASQVLNSLVLEGMRGAISGKLIPLRAEEVETPPPVSRTTEDCPHCENGTGVPEDVVDEHLCPRCGRDLLDLIVPF